MAIHPVTFHPDGTLDVWHDERQHGGTIELSAVEFDLTLGSSVIHCPVPGCDSSSVHPPGGGCDPEMVQRLHARKLQAEVPGRTWHQATALLRARIAATEGDARFKLADVATEHD